jgi:hypothetical protein
MRLRDANVTFPRDSSRAFPGTVRRIDRKCRQGQPFD